MQPFNTRSRWIRLIIGVVLILGLVYLYVTRKELGHIAKSGDQVVSQLEHQGDKETHNVTPPNPKPSSNTPSSNEGGTHRPPSNQIVVKKTGDSSVDRIVLLILAGGPFPYPEKDGTVFRNYEKRLPEMPAGYYHEYTVPTPGSHDRGPRRIVTGGTPPIHFYFTPDHYNSFEKLEVVQ